MIQTAKENGLEPYAYLTWVLNELPQVDILRHPDRIRAYHPWSAESQKAVPALKKAN
ncbi:transposase domain-containing protein [Enterococcus sp. CWB-B31]|nr:transposase domain-containing protein [Enterococcus sp. CWB-B31]